MDPVEPEDCDAMRRGNRHSAWRGRAQCRHMLDICLNDASEHRMYGLLGGQWGLCDVEWHARSLCSDLCTIATRPLAGAPVIAAKNPVMSVRSAVGGVVDGQRPQSAVVADDGNLMPTLPAPPLCAHANG